jgi:hypothetical protein
MARLMTSHVEIHCYGNELSRDMEGAGDHVFTRSAVHLGFDNDGVLTIYGDHGEPIVEARGQAFIDPVTRERFTSLAILATPAT